MKIIFTLVLSLWTLSVNAQVQTICSNDPVPAGWITTDIDSTPCQTVGSINYYSRTIQKIDTVPSNTTLTICSDDPVPAGWIITATSSTPCRTVGSTSYYSRTIQKVDGAPYNTILTICSADPVPAGWITTDISSTPCRTVNGYNTYSRTIQNIDSASYGTTLTICSGDWVPAGWITTYTSPTPCRTVSGVSYYSRTIQKISSAAARGIMDINDSTDLTDKGFAQTHPIEQIAPSIFIAPNPSKTSFRIGFNGFKEGKAIEYAVYEMTGRLIEAGTIYSPGVPKVIGEHYVAGVYILKIRQESFSKTEKFVKE
jgi:hypothetical protein